MELVLAIIIALFAIGHVFEKATNLLKQLKAGSAKLSKGFTATLSFVPIHSKKSEVSAQNTNSTNDDID